jgi:hypothetical protein
MLKTVIKSALAVSIATGGIIALAAVPSSAATTLLTAGPGSSLSCTVETTTSSPSVAKDSTLKITPSVKNDFTQSEYTGDAAFQSQAALTSLANDLYGANGGNGPSDSSKGAASCSGTIVSGANNVAVSGVTAAWSVTTTTLPHGNDGIDPATCLAQVSNSNSGGSYAETIKYSGLPAGYKMDGTTITGMAQSQYVGGGTAGAQFSGGTISGSFAGGSDNTIATIDLAATTPIFLQAPESGAQILADNGSYTSLGCQPTFKVKYGKGAESQTGSDPTLVSASLVAPKGVKGETVTGGSVTLSA